MAEESHVPSFLRCAAPQFSDLVRLDARVPLERLLKALSEAGLTVINDRTGKLVITCHPEDFKASSASA